MLLENSWPSLFALVVIVAALWFAMQPRCAFIVRINRGHPKAVRGKVTAAFLDQVRETCQQHGVQNGTVRGLIHGKRIALNFSRTLPSAGQQQLRNWWANWGWSAKPLRA